MRPLVVNIDTSPEALAVQTELYRRMGASRRLATMYRLNAIVRSLAMAGIRGIVAVTPQMDRSYIEYWAGELGLADLWERVSATGARD